MKVSGCVFALLLLPADIAFGQVPAFEVASIKLSAPLMSQAASGKFHIGMNIDAARVDIGSLSLMDLIMVAYKMKPYQISGPPWMSGDRFDIMATIPAGATKEQVPEMLQALLAERFGLKLHRDSKEHAIYALVVGKSGSRLKPSVEEVEAAAPSGDKGDDKQPGSFSVGGGSDRVRITSDSKGTVVSGGRTGSFRVTPGANGVMHMEASRIALPDFADMISRFADLPIVDMTGLKGNYQVAFELSMADMMKAARSVGVPVPERLPGQGRGAGAGGAGNPLSDDAASDPSDQSIFQSVQQLGLKLEPRKAPVEVLVIDHLEKAPTEN